MAVALKIDFCYWSTFKQFGQSFRVTSHHVSGACRCADEMIDSEMFSIAPFACSRSQS